MRSDDLNPFRRAQIEASIRAGRLTRPGSSGLPRAAGGSAPDLGRRLVAGRRGAGPAAAERPARRRQPAREPDEDSLFEPSSGRPSPRTGCPDQRGAGPPVQHGCCHADRRKRIAAPAATRSNGAPRGRQMNELPVTASRRPGCPPISRVLGSARRAAASVADVAPARRERERAERRQRTPHLAQHAGEIPQTGGALIARAAAAIELPAT